MMKGNKMREYTEVIHNVETDEITYRPYTDEEIKQAQELAATNAAIIAKIEAELQAKAAARQAIADRLGLTADELQVLLG